MLKIATVLVTMANEKYIWWLNFQQKSPIGDQPIWTKIYEKKMMKILSILGRIIKWTNGNWKFSVAPKYAQF